LAVRSHAGHTVGFVVSFRVRVSFSVVLFFPI
jgi:hypothetical protein